MGAFNKKLEAVFDPPQSWILSRVLSYKNENIDGPALIPMGVKVTEDRISVKKGFKTDLASVPRLMWNLIAPWDVARAAIIHDYLYKAIRLYRLSCKRKLIPSEDPVKINSAKKAADNVFLMGMLDAEPPVPKWKIYPAYWAVYLFGKWSIMPRKMKCGCEEDCTCDGTCEGKCECN